MVGLQNESRALQQQVKVIDAQIEEAHRAFGEEKRDLLDKQRAAVTGAEQVQDLSLRQSGEYLCSILIVSGD